MPSVRLRVRPQPALRGCAEPSEGQLAASQPWGLSRSSLSVSDWLAALFAARGRRGRDRGAGPAAGVGASAEAGEGFRARLAACLLGLGSCAGLAAAAGRPCNTAAVDSLQSSTASDALPAWCLTRCDRQTLRWEIG